MTTKVEAHLASCKECRTLVRLLAPAPGDQDSDVVTWPRAIARGKRHHAAALSPTEPRGSEPRRPLEPVVAIGDTIDRYVVLRRVGAGGMGVVYAAYDPQLDRKVALKLLRTGIGLGEGEAKARLVREAQAIAQLSHPNVVAVYDVGNTREGDVYVAMEFVEGDTLTQWLHRWERPWRDTLDVFREAGRGLSAAHSSGLLHRDFKPDNVLVGSDGRVRVTDFGLARSLVTGHTDDSVRFALSATGNPLRVTLTATGAVMGTPRYMAPEQLRGEDVSAAADQFSFCVALYEALYGVHPIAGDTAVKMVEENARAQPPPLDASAPAWLWPVLARGLD
ncbi:MAG: serine/threonine protein kinase, partial [Kofleriaceae bacterium]